MDVKLEWSIEAQESPGADRPAAMLLHRHTNFL